MTEAPASPPLSVYEQRLAERQAALKAQRERDRLLANLRLATFAAGVIVAGFSLATGLFSLIWILPLVGVFVALVIRHDRVIRECERLERAVEFYERGIARLQDRWAGRGKSGLRFSDPEHPYAEDLDLFGRGSLYERLCTVRTPGGEECLTRWLLAPAAPEAIRRRQEAVTELRDLLDVREELDLLAVITQKRVEPGYLTSWAQAPAEPLSSALLALTLPLGLATVIGIVLWLSGSGLLLFFLAGLAGQALIIPLRRRMETATKGLSTAAWELSFLEPVLAHLERDPYRSADLHTIRDRVGGPDGSSAVEAIRRLQTLDGYWQMRGNFFTGPLVRLLLLTPHTANAVANWRRTYGPRVQEWVAAVGEFEALSALASYAYENPDDVFPTIRTESLLFAVEEIAHPLLPKAAAVANSITLDATHRLYVVSGSNMSGKSTLLRSIGANAVLAQAGAPVRARSLSMSPLQIGASIRTQDSLQEGVSRFYAEIRRLHTVVELAGGYPPVLFLLDEVLHGTNSHDRRIGAEAVVRALLSRGAIGLITTHDLAIARIAEDPSAAALNVHFQDELLDGKMSFDYRLRQGVVEKSNALELMRAVGLDV